MADRFHSGKPSTSPRRSTTAKHLKKQASGDDLPLSLTSVSPSARVTDDDVVQERIQVSLELR